MGVVIELKLEERVRVGDAEIKLIEIKGRRVRVNITAPREVPINRMDRINEHRKRKVNQGTSVPQTKEK